MNFQAIATSIRQRKIVDCDWPREYTTPGGRVLKRLGNGSFGCAYDIGDGRVLKVAEGLDATCVWIQEAARVFAKTGKPGRCMPKVWEFHTMADTVQRDHTYTESPGTYTRMPDGSLVKVAAVYRTVQYTAVEPWWFAVMEKVEAYHYLSRGDANYVHRWGEQRGITHFDVYAKNCGKTDDGRLVTFDPFFMDPPDTEMPKLRSVSTGYNTGRKAIPSDWMRNTWQALRKGPVQHGRRWC